MVLEGVGGGTREMRLYIPSGNELSGTYEKNQDLLRSCYESRGIYATVGLFCFVFF